MKQAIRFTVVPKDGRWEVRDGGTHCQATHAKKSDAWSDARRRARSSGGMACIQERSGVVEVCNIYIRVDHYVISSGIREMVLGTRIAKKFKAIFASSFMYDNNDAAYWPALALNYTTKTQYLFRINKGSLDVFDHTRINEYVPMAERPIPFERMIFIGDGDTDSRAVLEVRSHEVPFMLEHGQTIGWLRYEQMARRPSVIYGQSIKSNYQGQGLALAKQFRSIRR